MSQGAILPVSAAHDSFFEPYQVYRGIGNDTDRELDFGADSNLPLRDLGTPPDTQTGVSSKDAASFVQLLEPKDYSKARPNRKRNYLTPALSRIETSKRSLGHRLPWRWEILSWLMSLLAFLAIVIILAIHDGQPIPQWRFGITLNAMISILSTLGTLIAGDPSSVADAFRIDVLNIGLIIMVGQRHNHTHLPTYGGFGSAQVDLVSPPQTPYRF